MSNNSALIDNWTLQCVGELLERGFFGEEAHELQVHDDRSGHAYKVISRDTLNIRCLLQLLNNIVLNDNLLVDKAYANTWMDSDDLQSWHTNGLIIPKPFGDIRNEWLPRRDKCIDELCITESMRQLHQRNVERFKATGENEDPFFSQLIWGGAGMLARASVLDTPYCSHPIRDSWFNTVSQASNKRSGQEHLQAFLSDQRTKVFNQIDHSGRLALLKFPPVAAIIINEARHPSELLNIALQVRNEYAPLRKWIDKVQKAMDAEDHSAELKLNDLLRSVAKHLDEQRTGQLSDNTTLQLNLKFLTLKKKLGNPINRISNRFQTRSLVNKLVFAPSGSRLPDKILQIFGEQRTRLGVNIKSQLNGD